MTKNSWKNFSKTVTEVLTAQELTEEQSENILKALESKKTSITKAFRPSAPKDPNHPKKPLTSYLRWAQEVRPAITEELKKKSPKLEGKDRNLAVMAELKKRWAALSKDKKSKYEKAYEKDKATYDKEMESYTPPAVSGEDAPARKSRKGEKKGVLTGYTLFCKEQRPTVKAENPDMKPTEIMSEFGRLWKEVSEEEKAEYNKRAANTSSTATTKTTKTKTSKSKPASKSAATTEEKKTPAKAGKSTKASKPAEEKKTTKGARTPKFNETPGYKKFCKEENDREEANIPGAELQKRWLNKTDEQRAQYDEDARDDLEAELEDEDN